MTAYIHVVAGALCRDGQVLIAQRPPGKHLAGGWEFPGGKLHADESAFECLRRELNEELGVEVQRAEKLCDVVHDYSDRRVLLELWLVNEFDGLPVANEGQALQWASIDTLHGVDMLPADVPLIMALQKRMRHQVSP